MVERSTEETLAMEKKFDVAKKATKKKEAEILSLKLKIEALMQKTRNLKIKIIFLAKFQMHSKAMRIIRQKFFQAPS